MILSNFAVADVAVFEVEGWHVRCLVQGNCSSMWQLQAYTQGAVLPAAAAPGSQEQQGS
jgi:hypothetical protein